MPDPRIIRPVEVASADGAGALMTAHFRDRRCTEILEGHHTVFQFDGPERTIGAGGMWRVRDGGRVIVARDDDGQMFGLPAPVNARARALERLGQRRVIQCRIGKPVADLSVDFEGDVHLEFFVDSCGYESWEVRAPDLGLVAWDGGQLAGW